MDKYVIDQLNKALQNIAAAHHKTEDVSLKLTKLIELLKAKAAAKQQPVSNRPYVASRLLDTKQLPLN